MTLKIKHDIDTLPFVNMKSGWQRKSSLGSQPLHKRYKPLSDVGTESEASSHASGGISSQLYMDRVTEYGKPFKHNRAGVEREQRRFLLASPQQ